MTQRFDDIEPSRVNKSDAYWDWTTPNFLRFGIQIAKITDIDIMLPTETGNAGKFLTTNGSVSSWAYPGGGGGGGTIGGTVTGGTPLSVLFIDAGGNLAQNPTKLAWDNIAFNLTIGGGITYQDGNEGAGKILTSDVSGNATWQPNSGGGGSVDSVTGTSPIVVDNTDPINPIVTLDEIALADDPTFINELTTNSTFITNINTITGGGEAVNQTAHGFVVGDIIRSSGVANTYQKAQADSAANAEVVGMITLVIDVDNFTYRTEGIVDAGVPAQPAGTVMFLDPVTPGALTATEPTANGQVSKPLGVILENAVSMYYHNYRGELLTAISGSFTETNGTDSYDLSTASGIQNIPHGLGVIPSLVKINAASKGDFSSAGDSIFQNLGVYNGTTTSLLWTRCTPGFAGPAGQTDAVTYTDRIIYMTNNVSGTQTAVITVDATNIILTWTKVNGGGAPTGIMEISWEAFA